MVSPFSFCSFGKPGPLMREGDSVILPYSTRSPIEYSVPILLYQGGGIIDIPSETSSSPSRSSCLSRLFNIWTPDWIHQSLFEECKFSFSRIRCVFLISITQDSSTFSFLRFVDFSPSEAHQIHTSPLIRRQLIFVEKEAKSQDIKFST